jgi:hypothetical protein
MRAKRYIESGQMEREYNALERDPRDAAAFSPPGGAEVRSGPAQLQIGESIASHAEPQHGK